MTVGNVLKIGLFGAVVLVVYYYYQSRKWRSQVARVLRVATISNLDVITEVNTDRYGNMLAYYANPNNKSGEWLLSVKLRDKDTGIIYYVQLELLNDISRTVNKFALGYWLHSLPVYFLQEHKLRFLDYEILDWSCSHHSAI